MAVTHERCDMNLTATASPAPSVGPDILPLWPSADVVSRYHEQFAALGATASATNPTAVVVDFGSGTNAGRNFVLGRTALDDAVEGVTLTSTVGNVPVPRMLPGKADMAGVYARMPGVTSVMYEGGTLHVHAESTRDASTLDRLLRNQLPDHTAVVFSPSEG